MDGIMASANKAGDTLNRHPLTGRSFAEINNSVEAVSKEVEVESKELFSACDKYRSSIESYDHVLSSLFSFYGNMVDEGLDVSTFDIQSIRDSLAGACPDFEAFAKLGQLSGMLRFMGRMSRKLREPCDRIQRSLEMIVDSKNVFGRWLRETEKRI